MKDDELQFQKLKADPKNLSKPNTGLSADEFLLQKERELGKAISPRFREQFKKELKAIANRPHEEVWRGLFGDKRR
ncbi:hypothetical protein [Leptospira kmetyi]|uniref:hypothetical protein n=1 Tax=Leptospira kmetyi TaxID=408139 RepID=UPI000287F3D0|nr:hypothetical protein [Leptospira kmetyi]EQA55367.1 hypothetical protein LEP1GSC052_0031 [Leptospira kmetyi serovar Malaysia str. Bejo-Iso9]